MMKGSALFAVALGVLAVADARSGGLRPGQARNLQSNNQNYQVHYYTILLLLLLLLLYKRTEVWLLPLAVDASGGMSLSRRYG